MKLRPRIATRLAALALAAGCAGTQVVDQQAADYGKLPRPDHIYVFDFAATPEDVPSGSVFQDRMSSGPAQTADQVALAREVGAEVAKALISEIAAMGLPAMPGTDRTRFAPGDLVIRGYLLSVDPGSAAERVAIGLGKGAAELKVAVEGFESTPTGLRRLGSGEIDTRSGKTPGAAAPLAVALATKNPIGLIVSTGVKLGEEASGSSTIQGKAKDVAKEIGARLKTRFEQQGWIEAD